MYVCMQKISFQKPKKDRNREAWMVISTQSHQTHVLPSIQLFNSSCSAHITRHLPSFFSFSFITEPVDTSVQPALLAASAFCFFFFLPLACQPRFFASLIFLAAPRSARLGRRFTVGDIRATEAGGGALSQAGTDCWCTPGNIPGVGLAPWDEATL